MHVLSRIEHIVGTGCAFVGAIGDAKDLRIERTVNANAALGTGFGRQP